MVANVNQDCPKNEQCGIIYIIQGKTLSKLKKTSNSFYPADHKKSFSWLDIWWRSQAWACEQNIPVMHTNFKSCRNSSIFHSLLAWTSELPVYSLGAREGHRDNKMLKLNIGPTSCVNLSQKDLQHVKKHNTMGKEKPLSASIIEGNH